MKIMKESKQEKLPIDFITQFISKGWDEIGTLKASIDGIKQTFSGTKDVEKILQELVDAYLIAIGQLELHLDKKNYVELPEQDEIKEALKEDVDIHIENNEVHIADASGEEVGIIPIEPQEEQVAEPTEEDWPEPDLSDVSDIEAAKDAIKNMPVVEEPVDDEKDPFEVKAEENIKISDDVFANMDFPDVEPDEEKDHLIHEWLAQQAK